MKRLKLKHFLPASRKQWQWLVMGVLFGLLGVVIINMIYKAQVPFRPQSATITSPWIPSTVKRWEKPIDEMAAKYKIDPNYIAIIMTLESGGYAKAGSEAEAKGLMQITPVTANEIATKHLKMPVKSYDIWNPQTNIEFGTAYLSFLRDEFGTAKQGPSWDSTSELVAAGYNGGPGASNSIEQGQGLRSVQTVIYSRDAFNMWRERHASTSPTFDRWKERGGNRLIDLAKQQK